MNEGMLRPCQRCGHVAIRAGTENTCIGCGKKRPLDRYPSAAEEKELLSLLSDTTVEEQPAVDEQPVVKKQRKKTKTDE